MDDDTRALLRAQDGTISRTQLLTGELQPWDIERMLRRRELIRLLPGAFVDHTGEPTWTQRAWVGIHHFGPAALDGQAALRATIGPGWRHHRDSDPIEIVVAAHLRRRPVAGYVVRRARHVESVVLANTSPPRLRLRTEHAALLVAARLGELDAVQLLADVCQSRRTTALRMLVTAGAISRLPRRAWLTGVLRDVSAGTCSVLEHGYLHRVELPHGLPEGSRQREVHDGRRDVEYLDLAQVVELDGRMFHDTPAQRDVDLDRDLVAAVDRQHAVRLGWGQVFDRPCVTAGRLVACSAECAAPGAWKP